jgi:acyl dehydratase
MRALGLIRSGRGDALPDRVLTREGVEIDREHLAAYSRVCGFRLRDEVPVTYPHVLAFPLGLELMADREFPFSALGLVHIANRIEVVRPIDAGSRLDLRVWCADLGPHERGTQFALLTEASIGSDVAWRERSTYLRREGRGGGGREWTPPPVEAVWEVPGDIGRRYARVSGDWNPIHLHRISARLFGQRGAIAHGMWTAARCLASLEGVLPGRVVVDVRFRSPVTVPGRVGFAWRDGEFRVWDLRSRACCVTGTAHSGGEA